MYVYVFVSALACAQLLCVWTLHPTHMPADRRSDTIPLLSSHSTGGQPAPECVPAPGARSHQRGPRRSVHTHASRLPRPQVAVPVFASASPFVSVLIHCVLHRVWFCFVVSVIPGTNNHDVLVLICAAVTVPNNREASSSGRQTDFRQHEPQFTNRSRGAPERRCVWESCASPLPLPSRARPMCPRCLFLHL